MSLSFKYLSWLDRDRPALDDSKGFLRNVRRLPVALAMFVNIGTAYAQPDTVAPMQPGAQGIRSKYMSTGEYRFASAMHITALKCISCHRAGGSATNFVPYLADERGWLDSNLVVARQSQNSLLFHYLKGSGYSPASMPLGGTLTIEELNIFRAWIDNLDPNEIISPTPTPTPGSGTAPGLNPSDSSVRLGNETFVKSVLDRIFGAEAAPITNDLIKSKLSLFGGVCDPMSMIPVSGLPVDQCVGVDTSVFASSITPLSTPGRSGQTMKACNSLVFNNVTLQNAIRRITGQSNLSYLASNPIPTSAQLSVAFDLFFRNSRALSPSDAAQLLAVAATTRAPSNQQCPPVQPMCELDPWRYTLLAICYFTDWQVV